MSDNACDAEFDKVDKVLHNLCVYSIYFMY